MKDIVFGAKNENGSGQVSGPAWDLSQEYPALDCKEIKSDLLYVEKIVKKITELSEKFSGYIERASDLNEKESTEAVNIAQEVYESFEAGVKLIADCGTYAGCELSVDGTNEAAKTLDGKVQSLWAKFAAAITPVELFLTLTTEANFEKFLAKEHTAPYRFEIGQARKLKDQKLSLKEEDMAIGLGVDGRSAWGGLYTNISGVLKCKIELEDGVKEVGLAKAASMQEDPDPKVREAAYRALNAAWQTQEESCASVLNALSGWRHEMYRRRSSKKEVHFLDAPLHTSRIKQETLEAMMAAVAEKREIGQRVVKLQAKALGKDKLGPWDLFAPCPSTTDEESKKYSYDEAIEMISEAFSTVDSDMGDFIKEMTENRWVEGRVGDTKRPGAYCTGFMKSRTPRVYMTYTGGMKDITTLAHELGHAFHSWKMRDLPLPELEYPMTLAETASIFAETVMSGTVSEKAKDVHDKFKVAWSDAKDVEAFVLNIPTRFNFEKEFYEKRKESILTSNEIKKLMTKSWSDCYGDSLSEMNEMFWASKLHFHISGLSFYNFPYTFGYLFSLGVYAQREKLGDKFYGAYVDLLCDTGRMTAEEVAEKHLGADITKKEFWLQSLDIVSGKVDEFEKLVNELF